jgi:hypothetical protein
MTKISISNEERFIKFSLLVLFCIVSNICAVYIIYNVIKIPSFRNRFQNQTLIILVFLVSFNTIFNIPTTFRYIDIEIFLIIYIFFFLNSFFARGYVSPETKTFCLIWEIFDYIFTASIIWCKAIFTLQRYILVFYPHYLRSLKQKLIFHYIPIILINLYLILFYLCIDLVRQCNYEPKYNEHLCGAQCLDDENSLSTFNWLFNILFPAFIIIFGSVILLLRVLWTRRIMQRNLRNWSKNWKMVIQLLGIAIIYTIIWLPLSIISLIEMFHRNDNTEKSATNIAKHFYFVTYLSEMSVPIVALLCWSEIMQKLQRRFRSNAVASVTVGPYSTY